MHRRLKALELRLARLAARLNAWKEDAEEERERRETRPVIASLLRASLVHAGVDPDEATALRRLEAPEPEPAPFIHPLRRLAKRPRTLLDALDAMTEPYRRRPRRAPPDLRHASVIELLAYYCFGDDAREAPA